MKRPYTNAEIRSAARIRAEASADKWVQTPDELARLLVGEIVGQLDELLDAGHDVPTLYALTDQAYARLAAIGEENRKLDALFRRQHPRGRGDE